MITDIHLMEFMQKLLADQRGKNPLILNEWEAHFLASFSASSRQTLWFTGDFQKGRRAATDRMWRKHGRELSFPHPLDPARPKLVAADPDACQYLVRDAGRQQPCNCPATLREPGKLRYCDLHGEAAVKAMERTGKTLRLIKYP